MKIIHTADLHLGQVIYQNYDRVDEHRHFFRQLRKWCQEEKPDALVVSGDIFDIQQPSAATKHIFNEEFTALHDAVPGMAVVITAGNHDSASRIQADAPVWKYLHFSLVGLPPSVELKEEDTDLLDGFIIELPAGFIVALPFMIGERKRSVQAILDRVKERNPDGKPVVMTGHLAVTGSDLTGHGEIGTIKTQQQDTLGTGYDYLALGHLHKPQTLGHPDDALKMDGVTYPSGVARYSGSVLHVSCDETFPHTVSVVEIPSHGADVTIRQLRIDELRHFYILPEDGRSFMDADSALEAVKAFSEEKGKGYFRLRIDDKAPLPSNFSQAVYDILKAYDDEVRFNPKTIWTGKTEEVKEEERPSFEVAELQQMTDPMNFIEKTKDQYPDLDLDMVREALEEVRQEMLQENK